MTEKPRSAGPADELGNAPTRPIREGIEPSSAEAVPEVIRELARSPEVFVGCGTLAFDTTQVAPGTSLGPYHILSRLGRGGMGVVYEAQDVRLGRRVALKFPSPDLAGDPDAASRLRREARAASALNHPNICAIYDVGEHERASYLVLELLEGETLLDRLCRGPILPAEFFDVALGVASALEAAGEKGIVHRDLKPANVFLTKAGGAKVLDFGLARLGGAPALAPTLTQTSWVGEHTRPGTVMGTLQYMSPEQVRGEPTDARSDLFSFGVVLYEMAAGRHPFAASTPALVADAIIERDPVPLDIEGQGFPPEVASVISRALEKDLRLRYQTAAELRAELHRIHLNFKGSTLRKRLAGAPLPLRAALDYAVQLARGLAAVHEKGAIHGQLRPENLFITDEGKLKILDAGTAGVGPESSGYLSPEQAEGAPADRRSDIFSFGAILCEMLSGKRASEGDPPALSGDIPVALDRLVRRCLERSPEKRFPSARDLVRDLEAAGGRTPRWPRSFRILVGCAALAGAVVAAWTFLSPSKPAASIAVIPFVNVGGDKDSEYFSDGLTEELMNALSRTRGLRVAARTSSFAFKGRSPPVKEIGEQLGVSTVLEGSVRKSEGRVRITARLIEAASGYQLWSVAYDRDFADVFSLQDDLAKTIVAALRFEGAGDQQSPPQKHHTEDFEAYQLYLRGVYEYHQRPGDAFNAIETFQAAIALDPNYASPYAGLANAWVSRGAFRGTLAPEDAMPKAKAAAQRALALAPEMADPHATLGFILLNYDRDYAGSEREFKEALRLKPDLPDAHHWYSHLLTAMGRQDESLRESKLALQADPLNYPMDSHLTWYYVFAHDYPQAVKEGRRFLERHPTSARREHDYVVYLTAFAESMLGHLAEAERLLETLDPSLPFTYNRSELALVKASLGKVDEARRILRELEERGREHYVSAYDRALVHLALGERDAVFAELQQALDEHSGWIVDLGVDPRFAPVADDPRFSAILRAAGLRK